MAAYSYVALDAKGSESRGVLEVSNRVQAVERIRQMGLSPVLVSEDNKRSAKRSDPTNSDRARVHHNFERFPRPFSRVKTVELALFTRQLATMLDAGVPLLRSFRALERQQRNPGFKRVIRKLGFSIETGSSLTEALEAHPRTFSRLYVNMVRAGEAGGALVGSLRRLAEFMEKALKLKRKVKGALVYPAAVVVVAIGVVTLLVTYALPRFKEILQGLLSAPLPPFTRFVFGISDAIAHQIWLIAFGFACAGFCLALVLRTKAGRWTFDYFKLVMPVFGPLIHKVVISRFTRTLGTLLGDGVPILQALILTKESCGNAVLARLIGVMHENVKQGEPLAPTLQNSRLFPAMVADMVNVGEQSGALPDMLSKIADDYDEEVDIAARAVTSIIEPVLIVTLGLVVGSIVIAMFLPLIALLNGNLLSPGAPGAGD